MYLLFVALNIVTRDAKRVRRTVHGPRPRLMPVVAFMFAVEVGNWYPPTRDYLSLPSSNNCSPETVQTITAFRYRWNSQLQPCGKDWPLQGYSLDIIKSCPFFSQCYSRNPRYNLCYTSIVRSDGTIRLKIKIINSYNWPGDIMHFKIENIITIKLNINSKAF